MPSTTTESEIFTRLAESLRAAAEDCAVLAWHPRRGHIYDRFRKALRAGEGCCRQLYYWRDFDARWLTLGLIFEKIHQRCGHWLRTTPTAALRAKAHPEFKWLSEKLTAMHADMDRIRTAATGRRGPILPAVLEAPQREARPVQVMTPGGIILPAGFAARRAKAA